MAVHLHCVSWGTETFEAWFSEVWMTLFWVECECIKHIRVTSEFLIMRLRYVGRTVHPLCLTARIQWQSSAKPINIFTCWLFVLFWHEWISVRNSNSPVTPTLLLHFTIISIISSFSLTLSFFSCFPLIFSLPAFSALRSWLHTFASHMQLIWLLAIFNIDLKFLSHSTISLTRPIYLLKPS